MPTTMDRRSFLRQSGIAGGSLAALGPLAAYYAKSANGAVRAAEGYGPLVNKGDLWLPADFNYQVLSRQGTLMSDGRPTPGIFDGMGAYRGDGTTMLIRNHENREQAGEQKVVTGPAFEYDELARGGNTKLEVRRTKGRMDSAGNRLYTYEVVRDFAILGGTTTNCAGGYRGKYVWLTCEEVVKRSANGKKHGYIFEIDARANGPVPAIPVVQAGRRAHEAALERNGVVYMTEDRSKSADPLRGQIGAAFYRYRPRQYSDGVPLHETSGPVEALAIKGQPNKDMDLTTTVGQSYPVEWVPIPEPDHNDDTDNRLDRVPGFTPNRVQAADRGAAIFSRQEGMWLGHGQKIYFDCTSGGKAGLGQVWEYAAGRDRLTLIYESTSAAMLENPDNVVVVPHTGDILVQEDSNGEQYVRGVTLDGDIYDFAKTETNSSEFCGACFDPDHKTLYLNQQGNRGSLPSGPAGDAGVTYAIYGPFSQGYKG